MIGLIRRFALALLLLPAIALSASAVWVDLTWTGATLLGNDGIGLFGPAGTVPAGTPYIARFRFDTSIGFSENLINGSQHVEGGTFFDPDLPNPWVSASLTLNSTAALATGAYDSLYFRQTGQGASQISSLAQREPTSTITGELFQRVFRTGNFYTLPLNQPGEFDFDASDNPGGEFLRSNRDGQGNIVAQTQIGLVPSHLSITLAVPELATFTYAICGAIGACQILRRRHAR